jgi:hypothetical protein
VATIVGHFARSLQTARNSHMISQLIGQFGHVIKLKLVGLVSLVT